MPSMLIGVMSQSCSSLSNVEKLDVLSHIPYQNFGFSEFPEPNVESLFVFFNDRAADGA